MGGPMPHRFGLVFPVAEDDEYSVMGVFALTLRCLRTCATLAVRGALLSVLACAPPASARWDMRAGADMMAMAAAIPLRLLCTGPSTGFQGRELQGLAFPNEASLRFRWWKVCTHSPGLATATLACPMVNQGVRQGQRRWSASRRSPRCS